MSQEEATIMMVTYNRLELTKRMLDSLFQKTKYPFNIVIIDNGSTDGTVEFLTDYFENSKADVVTATLFFNSKNKGIAVGRNQAMKIADENFPNTKWYCTIDNDVELPDGWLTECIDIMSKNPNYGMIGVNMEGKPYPLVTKNGKTFQNKPAGNLGTACMVFPKSIHQMLGFFNTEYGLYGEEDADWGMRGRVLGISMGYVKEMGNHFGVGENDQGEYREWKTEKHSENLTQFNQNCAAYSSKRKQLYIPYKE